MPRGWPSASRRRVSGAFRSSIRLVSDADSKPLGAPVGRSFRNLGYQTFQVARTFVVAAETGSLFLECLDIDSAGPLTEMTWPVWRSPRQSEISSRRSDDARAARRYRRCATVREGRVSRFAHHSRRDAVAWARAHPRPRSTSEEDPAAPARAHQRPAPAHRCRSGASPSWSFAQIERGPAGVNEVDGLARQLAAKITARDSTIHELATRFRHRLERALEVPIESLICTVRSCC